MTIHILIHSAIRSITHLEYIPIPSFIDIPSLSENATETIFQRHNQQELNDFIRTGQRNLIKNS